MVNQRSPHRFNELAKKAEGSPISTVKDITERRGASAMRFAALLVLFSLLLVADLVTPLSIEIWVFYIFTMLLAPKAVGPRFLWPLAGLSTALTLVGFFFSPLDVPIVYDVANRLIGICMFSVVAWLLSERARNEQRVLAANEALEVRVEERTEELQKAYEKLLSETRQRQQVEEQLLPIPEDGGRRRPCRRHCPRL